MYEKRRSRLEQAWESAMPGRRALLRLGERREVGLLGPVEAVLKLRCQITQRAVLHRHEAVASLAVLLERILEETVRRGRVDLGLVQQTDLRAWVLGGKGADPLPSLSVGEIARRVA